MKLDRRAFLQLAAGVLGGTLLSPTPWKMADDSAIWSQNWSWRPSPERGHMTRLPTTCVLCEGGCGIMARRVNENRAILLEGNPAHPVNEGGVCPLCASGLQFLYAPYRIAQPLKQTKKRGEITGFQQIGWDEALSLLTAKLAGLRSESKAGSVACITAKRRSSMDELWQQFMTAYGSPNLFKMPSHADSLELAAALATGLQAPLAFALEKATYVLSFGAGLIEGWGAPGRLQALYGRWQQEPGGKKTVRVVQVESRCSMTAAKADRWIAVSPGAEAALALGMAHVLIAEGLYDASYIRDSVFGFDDWTDSQGKTRQGFKDLVLKSYSPEQTAQLAGVDAATVRELAREFASPKSAVAVWGQSRGDTPENIYHDLAFLALNLLKGSLKTNGMISLAPVVPLGALPEVQPDEAAKQGLQQKRLDLALPAKPPFPGNGLFAFLKALAKSGPYPISVLMVHEANPAYCLPDSDVFRLALQNVGWMASFSSYMDETALHADLVLPSHTAFERYDDVIGLPGAPYGYYAVASPVLPPQLDTRHTGDVLLQIGKQIGESVGSALPWKSYDAYLQERVKGLASSGKGAVADQPGIEIWKPNAGEALKAGYTDGSDLWKKLTGGMCWYDAPNELPAELKTPSGKIELALQALEQKGLPVSEDQMYLPHFAPLPPTGEEKDFPLRLVGYRMLSLADGYLPNPPFMTKTLPSTLLKGNDLFVELNPQTARSLGLGEGDRAALKTPRGSLTVRAHLSQGARPGVVYMAQGLGHEAYDKYIQSKGANANNVMEAQLDPITGLGTVWSTRAQLIRA